MTPRARRPLWMVTLSSWKFWMLIAYFAIVAVGAWQYRQVQRTANDEANARAKIIASASAAYESCVSSRPELAKLSSHLRGVSELALTLVANSEAVADATLPGDPQHAVRMANLHRLRIAVKQITAAQSLPVPTVAECNLRRQTLLRQPTALGAVVPGGRFALRAGP